MCLTCLMLFSVSNVFGACLDAFDLSDVFDVFDVSDAYDGCV